MKDFNIPIPEGYVIDVENSNLAKGIIKFKSALPILNWEDFVNKVPLEGYIRMKQFYDKYGEGGAKFHDIYGREDSLNGYIAFMEPIFANITEAKSITALMKLLLVRDMYIGSWEPNWENEAEPKYIIEGLGKALYVNKYYSIKKIMSFPNREMAELFIENNKELLEEYYSF